MALFEIKIGVEEFIRQAAESMRNRPNWQARKGRKKSLEEQLKATPWDEPGLELGDLADSIGRPGDGLKETQDLLTIIGARVDTSRPATTPDGVSWALRSRIKKRDKILVRKVID